MKILPFPELRQTYGYDCGAKATQAVLAYYGIDVREDAIIKAAGTTKKIGTPVRGVLSVLRAHGLRARVQRMTIDQLKKAIDAKHPTLLVLQAWSEKKKVDWENDWVDGHYVVAIGYDKRHIYFEDPSSVLRTYLSFSELEKRWHDVGADGKRYLNAGIEVHGKRAAAPGKSIRML